MGLRNCNFFFSLPPPLLFWHESRLHILSHLGLCAREMAFGLHVVALPNSQEESRCQLTLLRVKSPQP